MKEEADLIIKKYKLLQKETTNNISFYVNGDIVLCLCGIGKVQASIGTCMLIEKFQPQTLINIGIAGNGNTEKIQIGDVVVVKTCYQHDVYLPFSGNHLDYIKGSISLKEVSISENSNDFKIISDGICATGDQFIDDGKKIRSLQDRYNVDCVEMEAFSFLSAAREYQLGETCIVIKGISDGADKLAVNDHMTHLELAMKNSILVLDVIIGNK